MGYENWVDEETGEIFIDDEKIKHYENEIFEKKNFVELKNILLPCHLTKQTRIILFWN